MEPCAAAASGQMDAESLLLLSEENPAVRVAAGLLPSECEEPFSSEIPVADAWFLAFERRCFVEGVSRQQLKRQLLARLGKKILQAPRLCASAYSTDFMSYEEVRSYFLRACFPSQDPAYILNLAETLRGRGLSPSEAGGRVVLLECLLRRAFALHCPYSAVDAGATKRRLLRILVAALKPFAARTAASLALALRRAGLTEETESVAKFCGRLLALRNFVCLSHEVRYSTQDATTLGFDFNADLGELEELAFEGESHIGENHSRLKGDLPANIAKNQTKIQVLRRETLDLDPDTQVSVMSEPTKRRMQRHSQIVSENSTPWSEVSPDRGVNAAKKARLC